MKQRVYRATAPYCRKKVSSLFLAGLIAFGASMSAAASDPCEVTLCMWGKVTGQGGGSACSGAISKFFGIQVWKRGKFRAGATSDAREKFLGRCTEAKGEQKQIIRKFGRVLG
ncbi:TrbM/KikA/MpfK family conjugal transfer protein [Pseudomonas sp. Q1-7]|uniref:TrbM/KikA/MpfK family conjugal transfer protein n=1 Tax=Pseudomonas sp. Q1-7 TaxID=3020843 RepID=UPI0023018E3A|nr:TrbM/KikA/MpfK family conjugal transfer protein [Pseudomonas sp. Q1-7]